MIVSGEQCSESVHAASAQTNISAIPDINGKTQQRSGQQYPDFDGRWNDGSHVNPRDTDLKKAEWASLTHWLKAEYPAKHEEISRTPEEQRDIDRLRKINPELHDQFFRRGKLTSREAEESEFEQAVSDSLRTYQAAKDALADKLVGPIYEENVEGDSSIHDSESHDGLSSHDGCDGLPQLVDEIHFGEEEKEGVGEERQENTAGEESWESAKM